MSIRQLFHMAHNHDANSHVSCPLQCGAACFYSNKEWATDLVSNNTLFTGLSSLSLSEGQTPLNTPTMASPASIDCPLLALPGEIRNRIYRYVLIKPNPFAVKFQFSPRDTALLQANRMVYMEASTIFYYENTFRIPESLFLGAPILQHMENFYHVPGWRLKSMKRLVVEIPVRTPFISPASKLYPHLFSPCRMSAHTKPPTSLSLGIWPNCSLQIARPS